METTLSSKYQIVIPKAVRRKLDYKPGDKFIVTAVGDKLEISKALSAHEIISKYAGTLKNSAWKKEGIDAAVWIRRQRDRDWE